MSEKLNFLLGADQVPTHWYNLLADFPEPLPPPLHPGTSEPVTPDLLTAMLPENLVAQEMSAERLIEIPEGGARRLRALPSDSAAARGAS